MIIKFLKLERLIGRFVHIPTTKLFIADFLRRNRNVWLSHPTKFLRIKYGNINQCITTNILSSLYNLSQLRYQDKRMETVFHLCKFTFQFRSNQYHGWQNIVTLLLSYDLNLFMLPSTWPLLTLMRLRRSLWMKGNF